MVNRIVGYEESQALVDILPTVQVDERGIAECHDGRGDVTMRLAGVIADDTVGMFEHIPLTMGGFYNLNMAIDAREPLAVGFYFGISNPGSYDAEKIIGAARQGQGDGEPLIVASDDREVPIALRTDPHRHHRDIELIRKLGLEGQGLPRETSRLIMARARMNAATGAVGVSAPIFVGPENDGTNHFQLRGYDVSGYDAEAVAPQGLDYALGVFLVGAFDVQVNLTHAPSA